MTEIYLICKPLEIGGAVMTYGYPLNGQWAKIIRLNKSHGQIVSVSTEPTESHRSYRNREIVVVEEIKGIKTKAEYDNMTEQERLENIVEARKREVYQPREESEAERLEKEAREKADEISNTEITVHHGLDYYFTPDDTADRAAVKLNLSSWRGSVTILEPSAGNGHLIDAILRELQSTAILEYKIFWCENYGPAREILKQKYQNDNRIIHLEDDFLSVEPAQMFDKILMNPSWKSGLDRKHAQHAYEFLNDGGRLVAIVSNGTKSNEKFNEWMSEVNGWWDGNIEPGTFMGTQVGGAILVIQK